MSTEYNKIPKLKGQSNYASWRVDAEATLIMAGVWEVVETNAIQEETKDEAPESSDKGKSSTAKASVIVAANKEKFDKAWAVLTIIIDNRVRQQYQGIRNPHLVWKKLEQLYAAEDTTTRDQAIRHLAQLDSTKFASLHEYSQELKRYQNKLLDIGAEVPEWQFVTFFRMGLSLKYEALVFNMEQSAASRGEELDIDKLTVALVEHDRRTTNQEEAAKAMQARVGNHGKQDKAKSGKSKDNKDNKNKCPHCKGPHKVDKCWYKNADLRPDWWKPKDEKLVVTKGAKKAKSEETDVETARAFRVKASALIRATTTHTTGRSSQASQQKRTHFILDTGADVHCTWDRTLFIEYRPTNQMSIQFDIEGISGKDMEVAGIGIVILKAVIDGEVKPVRLSEVWHVPDMNDNLISFGTLNEKGCDMDTRQGRWRLHTDDLTIFTGPILDRSLVVELQSTTIGTVLATHTTRPVSWDQLHKRLAHCGMDTVKNAVKITTGVDAKKADLLQQREPKHDLCESCIMGKQTRTPSHEHHRKKRTERLPKGARWHCDIAGGGQIKLTIGGYRYVVALTDDTTDYTVIYMIKGRDELPRILKEHFAKMKSQGYTPAYIHGDNEIVASKECMSLYKEIGIQYEPTAPYNPHQNGVAERGFRTHFDRVRSILHAAGMPQQFWGEALAYAVYTKNRLPTKAVDGMTPIEAWTGTKPNISHLRPFGCLAYHHKEPKGRKLEYKSEKCRFVGYGASNQYRLWSIESRKIIISAHTRFDEQVTVVDDEEEYVDADWAFINVAKDVTAAGKQTGDELDSDSSGEQNSPKPTNSSTSPTTGNLTNPSNPSNESQPDPTDDQETNFRPINEGENDGAVVAGLSEDEEDSEDSEPGGRQLRKGTRKDYRELAGKRTYNKKVAFVHSGTHAFIRRAMGIIPAKLPIPLNVYDALNGPDKDKWMEAFQTELNHMKTQKVWDLLPIPPGVKPIPGRWVLSHKYGPTGEILMYKARWVAKGFRQIWGKDYLLTFSAVVKSMSWRLMLAIMARDNLEAEVIDIISAFLEALLRQRIWVVQPHGFEEMGLNNEELACFLRKALYGLKQAPLEWYSTLRKVVELLGFKRMVKDHSVFRHFEKNITIAIYVDDILIVAKEKSAISWLKEELKKHFRLKELGDVAHYLGMDITRDRRNRSVYITQTTYIKRLLEQMDMELCHEKGPHTPMVKGVVLEKAPEGHSATEVEQELYASLIGALQWIAQMTRFDILYAVSRLGSFTANPTTEHINGAKRVVKYLNSTINMGIRYGPVEGQSGKLVGYTDASHSDVQETSRSTSGYVFQYWNGPISARSRRQNIVAVSSAESEYNAAHEAAREALFLGPLLEELGHASDDTHPVTLRIDNQAAMRIANKPSDHDRTKHIRNHYHFVREMVTETNELDLEWVPSKEQAADILTKPLGQTEYVPARKLMGIQTAPRMD